jgi:ectoine hydroxylase-related dioxygenase (phytanoyl-CoA dioxygenase family)
MEKVLLTPQQSAFMDLFGFLVFPGLLSDRIGRITEEFEEIFERTGGHHGVAHDGTRRSCIVPFIDQSEYLSSLLDDPRVDGILSSLLGDDYSYLGSDGNFYTGHTGWHSDADFSGESRGTPPRTFYKLAMYLDPVDTDSGALRVIPGIHRHGEGFAMGLEQVLRKPLDSLGIGGDQVPAVSLASRPGDVVVFSQAIKHSSWGGSNRRRMFTINATSRYRPDEVQWLRKEVAALARFWVDGVYGEPMLRTAGPSRLIHLEQGLTQDEFLAGEVVKAKAEMSEPARG